MYLFCDGNNLAARCFYAQIELHTQAGERSGLVHGFLKSLGAVRTELGVKLENTVVFWDGGRCQRRIDLYPDYKKGRKLSEPKTEHEVQITASYRRQIAAVKKLLATRPLRQIEVPGVEADDLMALLAHTVNDNVIINSRDQDLHQVVSDKVLIYDSEKGILTKDKVAEHWGLPTFDLDRLLLRRALEGDKGDNVKGVPGIGPVWASRIEPFLRIEPCAGGGILTQSAPCPHEATQTRIDKCLAAQDIVKRNILLQILPTTDWSGAYYEPEALEAAMQQFLVVNGDDWLSWISQAASWELEEILDQAERWV